MTIRPHLLVLLDWKETPLFLTNVDHPIYWKVDGVDHEFKGLGGVSSITGLEDNKDMSATEVRLDMLLVGDMDAKEIKQEDYQGRNIYIWEVRLNEDNIVTQSTQRWIGLMSHHTISLSSDAAVISLICSDKSTDWDRSSNHLINHERQTERYPDDNFGMYITELKDAVVVL